MASKLTITDMEGLISEAFLTASKLPDTAEARRIRKLASQAQWMMEYLQSQKLWLECWRHKNRIQQRAAKRKHLQIAK